MAAEAVKVIVRCRPPNERERNLNCKTVITMESARGQCAIQNPNDAKNPPKAFFFDGAYFIDSSTDQIYADIAYPLVEGVTEGYNGTIFAYGQTGCGKSFTMQGIPDPPSQRGIIPRAFDHIFETISVAEKTKFLVHASYLEIYNEEIRDLLGKNVKAKLDLKEHPERGVYVAGLSMHKVTNVKECQVVMDRGWQNRATGATLMNADSSRSHSIFTIYLEMGDTDESGEEHIRAGKLNLVDLAGSERQSKTGATGDRLKEATKINLSLSALGNVISALVDAKIKHIPYRDSKLTRLLQDSLGGNTKTLMVACLSPADNNYDETLSTLRYANRAKNIQNKPKINEDPKDALLRQYQEEIQRLQMILAGKLPVDGNLAALQKEMAAQVDRKREEEIEKEKERMQQEYEERLEAMQKHYAQQEADKAKLQEDMLRLRSYYDSKISDLDLKSSAQILGEDQDGEQEELRIESVTEERQEQLRDEAAAVAGFAVGVGVGSATDIAISQSQASKPVAPSDGGAAGDAVATTPAPVNSDGGAVTSPGDADEGVLIVNREGALTPDEHYVIGPEGQEAIHVSTTHADMSQEEALKRLQMLESGFVGGEQANNVEAKERRTRKKKHAEERKRRLAAANADLEDEGIMVGIYESIQDELRAKNKLLMKEREQAEMMKREIIDLQSEFEFDRADYLDTIRKQERQIRLLQSMLDRVQPCIRRDCNYSNLDKIKHEARWDEDTNQWVLPSLAMERTSLPGSNGRPVSPRYGNGVSDDERYYQKLNNRPEQGSEYFQSRRVSQLLVQTRNAAATMPPHTNNGGPPPSSFNMMSADPISKSDMRAAAVHGQMLDMEPGGRRPTRLEALPLHGVASNSSKRGKKKRNDYY